MDPTANLPFNLSLSDKEKEARSQVVLPYTYNKERFVIFFVCKTCVHIITCVGCPKHLIHFHCIMGISKLQGNDEFFFF